MKTSSLDVVARLARVCENEAGEAVNDKRRALHDITHQISLLQAYEKALALEADPKICVTGQALRARAQFRAMATRAAHMAEAELVATCRALNEATSEWVRTRERRRVLEDKRARLLRAASREGERKLERVSAGVASRKSGNA